MRYVRLFADPAGETHFEEVNVELTPADFAPPAPPLHLSAAFPASRFVFLAAPSGWFGDWHPAPCRQIFAFLSGEIEVETSDGERRRFLPGDSQWPFCHWRWRWSVPGLSRVVMWPNASALFKRQLRHFGTPAMTILTGSSP